MRYHRVGETVRDEWRLSDTALGSLGTALRRRCAARLNDRPVLAPVDTVRGRRQYFEGVVLE